MKLLILLSSILLLGVGCNKKSDDYSSYSTYSHSDLAKCAPMDVYNNNSNTGFSANIQTLGYIKAATFFENVQVKLTNMPAAFSDGQGIIEFYRFQLSGNQAPVSDNQRLMVDLVPKNYVMGARRGLYQVSYSEIQALGGINEVMLAVGVGQSANILELAYYNGNGNYQGSNYGLLPPFIADPDEYSRSKAQYGNIAQQEIMKYHPMADQARNSSVGYYKQAVDSRYCFQGLTTDHP